MEVTFMSKHHPLLKLEMDNGRFKKINEIIDTEHMPYSMMQEPTLENFLEFINCRSIPENRDGLPEMVSKYGASWKEKKHYTALTDQYFIKYGDEMWEDVSFHRNGMDDDIGDAFFVPWIIEKVKKNNSPDMSTGGIAAKRWVYENGDYYLLKAKSRVLKQEPLNEVLATEFLRKLDIIPFVEYSFSIEGVTIVSKCKSFVDENHELVSAAQLLQRYKKPEDTDIKEHLINLCKRLGIEDASSYLEKMNFVDAYLGNKDRHLNNIGFIRDVESGKIDGFCPLFDFGQIFSLKSKADFKKYKKLINTYNLDKKLMNINDCQLIIDSYPYISTSKKDKIKDRIMQVNKEIELTAKEG